MKLFTAFYTLLLTGLSLNVQADTIMLLHGYLGSSHEWQRAGITHELNSAGWINAGTLHLDNDKVTLNKNNLDSIRRSYAVELASEQSIQDQAYQLHHYVEYVRKQHPDEQIILVGHSAGGVVARLYMVEQSSADLIALVTIASPHLGTDKAKLAQSFSENVLAWFEPIPGIRKLYRSQGLFFDLIPNRSDNLIAWLNYQEHPEAKYYSIIREEAVDTITEQDFIVPTWSQDMNEVYALHGRSKTYSIKSMHSLNKKDTKILRTILIDLYTI